MNYSSINANVLEAPLDSAYDFYALLARNFAQKSGPYLGVVRNALTRVDVEAVLAKIELTRRTIPERWAAMDDGLEAYWISDPGRRDSRIYKRSTTYSFSAWQDANRELIEIMEPMFRVQLSYLGLSGRPTYRKPSDGEYDRAVFHEYECPEGFLTKHKDFDQPCPLQMLTLFQKDEPNASCGLVVEIEQGQVFLDDFVNPGDTIVFPFEILHGVEMNPNTVAPVAAAKNSTRIVGTLIRSNNALDSRKVYTV